MRIRAHFRNLYGGEVIKTITSYGTLEESKKRFYYVELDGIFYEWVFYHEGGDGFEYDAIYARISSLPQGASAWKIDLPNYWESKKCQCGAEKEGSPRHSAWCDKYEPY